MIICIFQWFLNTLFVLLYDLYFYIFCLCKVLCGWYLLYCINCPNFSHLPGFTLFSSFSTLTMWLVLVKTVAHKLDWSRLEKKKLLQFYSVFPPCDRHGESFASLLWRMHGGDQNHPLAAILNQAAPSWLTSWPKTHKMRLIEPGTWRQSHPGDP